MRTLGEPDAASATALLQKHVPIPKETDATLKNGAERLRAPGRGAKESKTHYTGIPGNTLHFGLGPQRDIPKSIRKEFKIIQPSQLHIISIPVNKLR